MYLIPLSSNEAKVGQLSLFDPAPSTTELFSNNFFFFLALIVSNNNKTFGLRGPLVFKPNSPSFDSRPCSAWCNWSELWNQQWNLVCPRRTFHSKCVSPMTFFYFYWVGGRLRVSRLHLIQYHKSKVILVNLKVIRMRRLSSNRL